MAAREVFISLQVSETPTLFILMMESDESCTCVLGGIRDFIDEQIVCSGVKVEGSGVTFVGKEQFLTIG